MDVLALFHARPDLIADVEPIDARNPANLFVVTVRHPETAWRDLHELSHIVEFVEPDYQYRIQQPPPPTPNDTNFSNQWNLYRTQNDIHLNAPLAWQQLGWPTPLPNYSFSVAVLDTGIDVSHPDLSGRISSQRFNGVDPTPTTDVTDDNGHGTAMAGIIAALGNNSLDVAGLMWGTTIVPCKMAAGETADLVAAERCFRWVSTLADGGSQIVAVNFSFASEGCSCILEQDIRGLQQRGILVVAATDGDRTATNDGVSGGKCPVYPAANRVSNIIAVTASDRFDNVVARGGKRSVHVGAPGQGIPVLWKRSTSNPNGMNTIPGTSPATAQVTGLVALLKAQDRCRDWRALRDLVLAGGVPLTGGDENKTISGRRIRAWNDTGGTGSMSCQDQSVRRRLLPVDDTVTSGSSGQVELRAISINCATPMPVPVQVSDASGSPIPTGAGSATPTPSFVLHDDGQPPDEVAGDGEFAATWTVPEPTPGRAYKLEFWNGEEPDEDLKVTVQ